jgi:hypothetical protein
MAGSMTDYLEKRVLDLIFRNSNASATAPLGLDATNVWVGLFTATPSDTGGGTEVSGGSYARVAVVRTGAGWNAATGALATSNNTGTITFPTATGSWGTVTQFGIFDAATVGNLLYWGDLTTSKTISSGDTATFAASAISITQD